MAFSGDLEHLSIVDVIQLLHTSRKSGSLVLTGRKGEISLAFHDGYIVGAKHCDDATRIGSILTEAGIVTQEAVDKALELQKNAGDRRKPLVATMVESGLVNKDDAYRGLQTLIEMTIVEILTWKKGSFALVLEPLQICDEYRYAPEFLKEDLFLPTEHLLMDAIRIYDEKCRDGLICDEEEELPTPFEDSDLLLSQELSADDLGLDDLGGLQRKAPDVHAPLKDQEGRTDKAADGFEEALRRSTLRLQQVLSLPETALILLETLAKLFPRVLTLVVRDNGLIAERSIGIISPLMDGPSQVMGFRVSAPEGSLVSGLLEKKQLYYGKADDGALKTQLYGIIGAPKHPELLMMPLNICGRVVSFTYADFGDLQPVPVPVVALEVFANQAALALENAQLRRQHAGNR